MLCGTGGCGEVYFCLFLCPLTILCLLWWVWDLALCRRYSQTLELKTQLAVAIWSVKTPQTIGGNFSQAVWICYWICPLASLRQLKHTWALTIPGETVACSSLQTGSQPAAWGPWEQHLLIVQHRVGFGISFGFVVFFPLLCVFFVFSLQSHVKMLLL